jgi:hypothetical protein
MKRSIKKILKEEFVSDVVKKGVEAAFSILKNDYPYLKKIVKIEEDSIYLNVSVLCDLDKVSEFYDSPVKSVFKHYPEFLNSDTGRAYPTSPLEISEDNSFDKWEDWRAMDKDFLSNYEYIPDEYKVKNQWGLFKEIKLDKFHFE